MEKSLSGPSRNNWWLHVHPGDYKTNYLDRAAAARFAIPASLPEDVMCYHTAVDCDGEPLRGAYRYLINLQPDGIPPVNAFWSVTLYDSRQHIVPNSLHRFVIRSRDRLRIDSDNSLSLHIQHDWPGANRDSNWLPVPKEAFNLALRMYWPKSQAVSGTWQPPAVTRTH
jgi:hypothetical protein